MIKINTKDLTPLITLLAPTENEREITVRRVDAFEPGGGIYMLCHANGMMFRFTETQAQDILAGLQAIIKPTGVHGE